MLGSLQSATLDTQAAASDESQLAKDVKAELESVMNTLAGKGKGKKPRGAERKKMWDEVKELRKEYVTPLTQTERSFHKIYGNKVSET